MDSDYNKWNEWSPAVEKIYDDAFGMLLSKGETEQSADSCMHFGPAHVVWDDGNYDSAEWCIGHFTEFSDDLNDVQNQIVMWSLVELAKIPVDDRFKKETE